MNNSTMTLSGVLVGLLLVVGLTSQSVLAERGWAGHRPGGAMAGLGGPRAELLFEALDLTPEQRAAAEGIMDSYQPRLKALRDAARDSRRTLMETSPDDAAYATVVAQASQAAANNASQLVLLGAELRRELHALLTPEQRDKALKLRAAARERFEARQERRRMHRQGNADEA